MVGNAKHFCVSRGLESLSPESQVLAAGHKAALLKDSRWQTGDQITIRFLDGDPTLQARVKAVALEWTKVANLNFVFRGRPWSWES